MGYEILSSDFSDFVSSIDEIDTFPDGEDVNRVKFTTPKGNINFKEQVLHKHMSILEGHYHMQDDVRISGKGDSALLEIQFNLSDKDIFYQDKSKAGHIAPAKSANIIFLSAEENEARILWQKNISYNTFDIHLPISLLDRYAGESRLMDNFLAHIQKGISSALTQNKIIINPMIYNTIQDMKTCSYEGLTRRIYLESKTYELIALLYENVENQKDNQVLSPADQEKIHWAASIIQNNLEKPFTIIELARLVGINQTKLKSGFRTIFGNTVFGYLQDIRMHQAKKHLLDTNLSIQEIGMLLGYQNTSNFSAAFKKVHGYPPMKLRGKQVS